MQIAAHLYVKVCRHSSRLVHTAITNPRAAAVPVVPQTIAWDPSPSAPACVKEYIVTTYAAGSTTAIKTTTVPVSTTQFTDNIYQPGKSYEFNIYAR